MLIFYFFDKCDEYRWFAITSAIGAAVVYLVYLYMFKKAVSSNLEIKNDIEIESGEIENKNKSS